MRLCHVKLTLNLHQYLIFWVLLFIDLGGNMCKGIYFSSQNAEALDQMSVCIFLM